MCDERFFIIFPRETCVRAGAARVSLLWVSWTDTDRVYHRLDETDAREPAQRARTPQQQPPPTRTPDCLNITHAR